MTPASGPIGTLVAGARRRAEHAVLGQALCLALGAYGVTLALALLDGAGLATVGAHIAAATAALTVGAAWRATHPNDARWLVRRADVALGLGGAFEAALEEESRGAGGGFAALTAARLLGTARPRELRAAAEPNAVPFAAAPLAAAVFLAVAASLALERRPKDSAVHLLAYAAADDLAAAIDQGVRQGSLSTETLRELAGVVAEARLLGAALAGSGVTGIATPGGGGAPAAPAPGQPGAADPDPDRDPTAPSDGTGAPRVGTGHGARVVSTNEAAATDLARRVDQLAEELSSASAEVRAALEHAALALDTLALGEDLSGVPDGAAEREMSAPVTAAAAGDMMGGSRGQDGRGGEGPDGRPATSVAAAPTPGEADSPSDSPSEATNADLDQGPAATPDDASMTQVTEPYAAPAVAAGRTWPARYDALAARWSRDHARAAATTNPSPTDEQ